MTIETKPNYTPEQTVELVQAYQSGKTVEQLAEALGKSVRSVVAKLSREGVYQARQKTKAATRVTKADMTSMLEAKFGMEPGSLDSLQKASHEALEALVARAV